tara:strand:+ start:364 stop:483 length:120 start_codon:yes stop_codon:yes gene_type:complete
MDGSRLVGIVRVEGRKCYSSATGAEELYNQRREGGTGGR